MPCEGMSGLGPARPSLSEINRKDNDQVSVEDEEFGDTDEQIIHAASSYVPN